MRFLIKIGKYFPAIIILLTICYYQAGAQVTGKVTKTDSLTVFHPSPRKAVLNAIVLPGLGQAYNRKYWKIPIVYAGFGALGYSIYFNNSHYFTYKQALIDFQDSSPTTDSYLKLIGANSDPGSFDPSRPSENFSVENEEWFKKQLENNMSYYKRYRDLSVLVTVGYYVLTVVDAAVDAFLSDYDISDDLSMKIQPKLFSLPGNTNTMGLQCSINF